MVSDPSGRAGSLPRERDSEPAGPPLDEGGGTHDVLAPELRNAEALVFVDDLEAPSLSDDDVHHLSAVLRLRSGATVAASDGRGAWRTYRYVPGERETGRRETGRRDAADRRGDRFPPSLDLDPLGDITREEALSPVLTVGFALTKGDRPELTVQKLTELGVDRIVPFVSDRTVVRLTRSDAERRAERLQRVARAAAAQSRRVWLPVVATPATFGGLASADIAMVLAEPGGCAPSAELTTILVGPEGGWTADELAGADSTVALGSGVLRAETAAIVAGAVLSLLRCGLIATPEDGRRGSSRG